MHNWQLSSSSYLLQHATLDSFPPLVHIDDTHMINTLPPILHAISEVGELENKASNYHYKPTLFPSAFAALDKMNTISTLVNYKSLGYLTLGGVFTVW